MFRENCDHVLVTLELTQYARSMLITVTGIEQAKALIRRLQMLDTIVYAWFQTGEADRIMQKSFKRNFDSGGRPKWEALAESTTETRDRLGFSPYEPILVRTGNFMDEITTMEGTVTHKLREVVQSWGIDNLRSAEREKFIAHTTGKGGANSRLPIRKTIGFQEEDAKLIKNSLVSFIRKNFA